MRIVHGVEVHNDAPPPTHYSRNSKWLPLLRDMEIGEYIDVDDLDTKESIVQSAKSTRYSLRKYSGVKIFVRTQKQANGKYRIWRVAE